MIPFSFSFLRLVECINEFQFIMVCGCFWKLGVVVLDMLDRWNKPEWEVSHWCFYYENLSFFLVYGIISFDRLVVFIDIRIDS